jgi:ubiquinol-cytochrome c reductase cytochrome b subunit
LIDQVSNGTPGGIQQGNPGGGNMPAFGSQIDPAEMTALVAFLESLRPQGEPRAEPASVRTEGKEYP